MKAVDDQVAANKDNITKNAGDIKTNKDNIDKNTTAIARKISLGGNTGSTDEKSLSTGDVKFNVKGENGLTTVANGDDVTVKLDDDTKDKIDNAANKDLSNLTPAGEQQVKDLAAWNVVANGETAEKYKVAIQLNSSMVITLKLHKLVKTLQLLLRKMLLSIL